jgi:membrane-associated phospholipid phosphatase
LNTLNNGRKSKYYLGEKIAMKTPQQDHTTPPQKPLQQVQHQHHTARNRMITGNARRHSLQPSSREPYKAHSPASRILTKFSRQRLKSSLSTAEIATIAILSIYAVLGVWYSVEVPNGAILAAVDIGLMWVMCILAISDTQSDVNVPRLLAPARRLLLFPTLLLVYVQAPLYVPLINPNGYDSILATWDKTLFGVNPTEWMYQFSHPILTELLQTCYILFFLIPLCLGIEFHRTKSDAVFRKYAAFLMIALYGSYLLYVWMPAIGPCFTLHDFSRLSAELPGVFLTETFRTIVNNGSGAGSATPALTAHRNCMPSGHTIATLVNIICAFRWHSRFRWLVASIGAGIIVSTVYLRYHYAVDILAGCAFALVFMSLAHILQRMLRSRGFSAA